MRLRTQHAQRASDTCCCSPKCWCARVANAAFLMLPAGTSALDNDIDCHATLSAHAHPGLHNDLGSVRFKQAQTQSQDRPACPTGTDPGPGAPQSSCAGPHVAQHGLDVARNPGAADPHVDEPRPGDRRRDDHLLRHGPGFALYRGALHRKRAALRHGAQQLLQDRARQCIRVFGRALLRGPQAPLPSGVQGGALLRTAQAPLPSGEHPDLN